MRRNLWAAGLVFALAGGACNADLVSNGGFETGDFTDWTMFGNTGFSGVTTGISHSGQYAAYFGPIGSEGGIRQTLTASANDTIRLSFWLHIDDATPNSFYVSLDGQVLDAMSDAPGAAYAEYTFDVVLANANPVLEFGFRHDPAFFYLDDVSAMNIVPIPAGAAIGLAGLAGVGGVAHVRRRRHR